VNWLVREGKGGRGRRMGATEGGVPSSDPHCSIRITTLLKCDDIAGTTLAATLTFGTWWPMALLWPISTVIHY
jgi:hypothetical protein